MPPFLEKSASMDARRKSVVVGLALFCFAFALSLPSAAEDATPLTDQAWQETVLSVTDLDRTARFFIELGGYDVIWRGAVGRAELVSWGVSESASGGAVVLGHPDSTGPYIRLIRFDDAGEKVPTRPGARAWDTGCYFSVMVRAKNLSGLYQEAIALGWWTETPVTRLTFGDSLLNVVVFRGPDGVQVQAYERLSLPLPEDFPAFDHLSVPFNMMQMVRDRDATYAFFTNVLGFSTFYLGNPYVAPTPTPTPLGIPLNLTTSARYQAGIVYPRPGELGRMEMIEMMDLDGRDYADRCKAPNLGILATRFPVLDAAETAALIVARDASIAIEPIEMRLEPYGDVVLTGVRTPDGANIHFFETRE
ncbi:MAG: hypothetical protein AAGH76_04525 [Pseudomonadota bacterium]